MKPKTLRKPEGRLLRRVVSDMLLLHASVHHVQFQFCYTSSKIVLFLDYRRTFNRLFSLGIEPLRVLIQPVCSETGVNI